jgi:hypothetical protein
MRSVSTWSNVAAIDRRIAALVAAIRECDALKLEAVSEAELEARLEGLRESIPSVELEHVNFAPQPAPAA